MITNIGFEWIHRCSSREEKNNRSQWKYIHDEYEDKFDRYSRRVKSDDKCSVVFHFLDEIYFKDVRGMFSTIKIKKKREDH